MESFHVEYHGFDEDLALFASIADVKDDNFGESSPGSSTVGTGFDWENQDFQWSDYDEIPTTVTATELNNNSDLAYSLLSTAATVPFSPDCLQLENEECEREVASKSHVELMRKYDLNDSKLSDITLKSLKRMCKNNDGDYEKLKAYRRTCLNRHYARSSRHKQQEKTSGLAVQLHAAQIEITELKKDLDEKNMRIEYLELENKFLKELKD